METSGRTTLMVVTFGAAENQKSGIMMLAPASVGLGPIPAAVPFPDGPPPQERLSARPVILSSTPRRFRGGLG